MPAKRPRPGAPKSGRVTAKGTPAAAPKPTRAAPAARHHRDSWNGGKHVAAPPTFRQKGVRGQR